MGALMIPLIIYLMFHMIISLTFHGSLKCLNISLNGSLYGYFEDLLEIFLNNLHNDPFNGSFNYYLHSSLYFFHSF